jgi:hypothetical protein
MSMKKYLSIILTLTIALFSFTASTTQTGSPLA